MATYICPSGAPFGAYIRPVVDGLVDPLRKCVFQKTRYRTQKGEYFYRHVNSGCLFTDTWLLDNHPHRWEIVAPEYVADSDETEVDRFVVPRFAVETMSLIGIIGYYRPGDEGEWAEEFKRNWCDTGGKTLWLTQDIARNGVKNPILLGSDGRIWDGHHRITAAHALGGITPIPVHRAETGTKRPASQED